MTMQDVESAVATISQRVSALEAHANKVATQDHVTLQTQIKAIEERLNAMEKSSTGSSSTTAQSGTSTRRYLPEKKHDPKDVRWRIGPVARVEGRCCRLLGRALSECPNPCTAIAMNRDTVADSTKKRQWAALGDKVLGIAVHGGR